MLNNSYSTYSGKLTLIGALVALAISSIVGSVLGAIYAYLELYIPLAGLVTILLTVGFGSCTGIATSIFLEWQRVRNVNAALFVGAAVAIAALYTSWVVWVFALLQRSNADAELIAIALRPDALWQIIGRINEHGSWHLGSAPPPTGVLLWIFWGIEAGTIVVLGTAIPAWKVSGTLKSKGN